MIHILSILAVLTVALSGGINQPVMAAGFPESVLESTVSVLPYRESSSSVTSAGDVHPEEPEGSGVAVFDGHYIATAAHVLIGAKQVSVRLHDGRIVPAEILGQDRFTDIALLKISAPVTPFALVNIGSIGDPVCSIGNQFGLGLSVTCGVVSAIHRSNVGFNPIEDFIQTDAVVNPGASGGALVNEQGLLVGMLSGIFTKDSDANIGVNFAVHTGLLKRVLVDLKDYGRVRRAKSGMVVHPLELRERLTQTGVRVSRVTSESPASRAGVRSDDIIVSMMGRKIHHPSDVSAIVYLHRSGDTIPMDVIRKGQQHSIGLVLEN